MAKLNKLPSDLKAIPAGDDLTVNCIVPSHDDKTASLHITRAGNGRILWHCFGGCTQEAVGDELRRLGLLDEQAKPNGGLTLSEYAAAKQLPAEYLRKHGVVNDTYFDKNAIKIPYGPEGPIRYRTSLTDGPDRQRFRWAKGSKVELYGLWHLGKPEYVILVEGESDVQTLWLHDYPAVGVPGAGNWKDDRDALHLEAIRKIYVFIEPGKGGQELKAELAKSRLKRKLHWIQLRDYKDVSELHIRNPDHFDSILKTALEAAEPASGIRKPTPIKGVTVQSKEFAAVNWAVPGILPQGVALAAGRPKIGKSFLALNLSIAVAAGGRALSKIECQQAAVLYLALEDNERRLQRRLNQILHNENAPDEVYFSTTWPRMDEGGIDEIAEWVAEHRDCRLVVIDTLAKFRTPKQRNVDLYDQDYQVLSALSALAHKHNLCVLVITHTRKASADDFIDEISGTTGLTGGADTILVLKRSRGEFDAILHVDGRDIEKPDDYSLTFSQEDTTWVLLGEADEFAISPERRAIYEALDEFGPLSAKAVSEITGKHGSTVRTLLQKMKDDGLVWVLDGKYYRRKKESK